MKSPRKTWPLIALALASQLPGLPSASAKDAPQTSPKMAHLFGDHTSGAYDVFNPQFCSGQAATANVGFGFVPPMQRVTFTDNATGKKVLDNLLVKGVIDSELTTYNRVMRAFVANGDGVVSERHFCFGMYDYNTDNAKSYDSGYIGFDGRLILIMNQMPERSSLSLETALLHEFGHQLQYWNGHPFANDPTVRRLELAADCAAGAMEKLLRHDEPADLWAIDAVGVKASVAHYGEFAFTNSQHHGTPTERRMAASRGIQIVENHFLLHLDGQGLTSRKILDSCNAYIFKQDAKYGENWAAE
jgi:hypothetical protein